MVDTRRPYIIVSSSDRREGPPVVTLTIPRRGMPEARFGAPKSFGEPERRSPKTSENVRMRPMHVNAARAHTLRVGMTS